MRNPATRFHNLHLHALHCGVRVWRVRAHVARDGWMRCAYRVIPAVLFLIVWAGTSVRAQTEPEAPREVIPLRNGWQLSAFVGTSYNTFSGGYFDDNCACSFIANESSWSAPFGLSVSIPVYSDASVYLRAGWHDTRTTFFTGRVDSLVSAPIVGDIGDELSLRYTLLTLDVLVRLIGKQDGERVYFGPSFGIVRTKRVRVVETEYATGRQFLLTDDDIEGGRAVRRSFVIGAEYAFVPFRELYIIPSIEVDYAIEKLSTIQPLRPTFYKFLLTVAVQPF